MKIAIILLVSLVAYAVSDCQNQVDCKSCISAGGCSYAIHLNGKSSCEKEEILDTLALKRILFSENDCEKFLKGKRLTRGEKPYLKASQTVDSKTKEETTTVNRTRPITWRSADVKLDRTAKKLTNPALPAHVKDTVKSLNVTSRQSPTLLTTPIPGNTTERKWGARTATQFMTAYNCTSHTKDDQVVKLSRALCRMSELIRRRGKVMTLEKDLFLLDLLNPMSKKQEECKVLKWKRNNCPVVEKV